MLSNDTSRVEMAFLFLSYLLVGPLEAVFVVVVLINMIDYSILGGLLILLIVIPFQLLIGKVLNRLR